MVKKVNFHLELSKALVLLALVFSRLSSPLSRTLHLPVSNCILLFGELLETAIKMKRLFFLFFSLH